MTRIKCSYSDQTLQKVIPALAFFYTRSIDENLLRQSLEKLAKDFPVLKGHFVRESKQLFIDCREERSVAFRTAQLPCSLLEQIESPGADDNVHLVDPLSMRDTMSGKGPVMSVKVNYFTCGGMAIGFSINHAVFDMPSVALLLRAWVDLVNRGSFSPPLCVEDRESYILQYSTNPDATPGLRYLGLKDALGMLYYINVKARTKKTLKFYFSDAELAALKQDYLAHCSGPVTTNDAIAAHLFSVFAELDGDISVKTLSLAVNARTRMDIPPEYVGNLISPLDIPAPSPFDRYRFAADIRTALNEFGEKHLNFMANHILVDSHGGVANIDRFVLRALDPARGNILITNWNRTGLYETGFGEGRLFYFSPVGKVDLPWASALAEGFEGQGLIYNITLPLKFAEAAVQPEVMAQIHRYRENNDELPGLVSRCDWLI